MAQTGKERLTEALTATTQSRHTSIEVANAVQQMIDEAIHPEAQAEINEAIKQRKAAEEAAKAAEETNAAEPAA